MIIVLAIILLGIAAGQEYPWPCAPVNQQHWINGTFCECREGNSGDRDHFHDGVDIDLYQGNPVYSVISGNVTSIGTESTYGINAWIRIGRYAYVHVNHNPALSVGSSVVAGETVIGWTNSWNHIHFKDGYPGNEINALRINGGLTPHVDIDNPTVANIKFYVDGTTTEFQNNRVFGFIDIVSRAYDRTDSGPYGNNNGIYKIGYDILDSVGNVVHGPFIPFEFSSIPGSDSYITNVYANGSNTSNYRYIVTNHLSTNYSLDVNNWPLGNYTARVFTWDQYLQSDTLTQSFQVVAPDDVPPDPPVLMSLTQENDGFRFVWQPNSEPDLLGYRLYFSYDNEQWYNNINESQLDAATTEFATSSFSNELLYLRLTAVDNGPFQNESDYSTVFIFRKSDDDKKILFINTELGTENHTITGLGQSMDSYTNFGFETISADYLESDSSHVFNTYPAVWISSGRSDQTISPDLVRWVEERNNNDNNTTILSGAFLASDLAEDSTGSALLSYFGVDSMGRTPTANNIQVTATGFLAPLGIFITNDTLAYGFHHPGITPLLQLDSASSLAWQWDDTGTCVLFSFAPTILPDLPLFSETMLNFLFPGWVNNKPDVYLPHRVALAAFPNPFNYALTLRLEGRPGRYTLSGWDLQGAQIIKRFIDIPASGMRVVHLHSEFSSLSSGIYFLGLSDADAPQSLITKVLLIK